MRPNRTTSPTNRTIEKQGIHLVTVETQREFDLLAGEWEKRTFVKLYVEARRSGLLAAISDRDWKTLCTLATYMDRNGYCYPSQAELASALGCSRQMANERIQSLATFRFHGNQVLIVVKGERSDQGRWSRNGYRILPLSNLRIFHQTETLNTRTASSDYVAPPTDQQTVSRELDTVAKPTVSTSTVSVRVDTNKNHAGEGDINLRISKGNASEKGKRFASRTPPSPNPSQSAQQSLTLYRSISTVPDEPAGFTSVGQTLLRSRSDLLQRQDSLAVSRPNRHHALITDQILSCIEEIARDFGDTRHLRSNLTQAVHLLEQSGLAESHFAARLYEARAITKDRRIAARGAVGGRTLIRPMAYFWKVARDLLDLQEAEIEATSVSQRVEGSTRQGRGEEWSNGQIAG
jgi:biotin operon repressor